MQIRKTILACGLMLTPFWATAAENPKLSNLYVIPLRAGMNTVPDFTLDGDRAVVTRAWRDNGSAPGFSVFSVTMPDRASPEGARRNWEFVSFFDGDKESLVVTDESHGENIYARSVRFAKGKVNDRTETLTLIAERDKGSAKGGGEPGAVAIQIFALRDRGDNLPVGRPAHFFERIATLKSQRRYCNAETALTVELNLPMPRGWPGNKVPDGCP